MSWNWRYSLPLLPFLAACVVNPQPEPSLRTLDKDRVLVSSPGADREALVAGDQGAAPGVGEVEVTQVRTAGIFTAPAAADGSFSASLPEAQPGDVLALVFRSPGGRESGAIEVMVARNDVDPLAPPAPLLPLPPPTWSGLVRITGTASPAALVVATDLDRPSTNSVAAGDGGEFALDLVAAVGDTVSLFAVDPLDPSHASEQLTTDVPAPETEAGAEACLNGRDDDGDGFVDCLDPDCEDYCRCPDGLTFCSGICTDTATDVENCLECGNVCERDQVCTTSGCGTR